MTLNQLNYLNIVLMVISAIIAAILPFELFLFSYAVLGPLHYLTEISWLHDRNYFSSGKNDFLWLALLAVPITISVIYGTELTPGLNTLLIWTALGGALGMVILKNSTQKLILGATFLMSGLLLSTYKPYVVLISTFIPTIIHVFVFTGLFILYGALKSRNQSGYLSFIIFILCAAVFFVFDFTTKDYQITEYVRSSVSPFDNMTEQILSITGKQDDWNGLVAVMRFVAYAYTYHYLNWFSKTKIIRWHEISRMRLTFITLTWISSLLIYWIDYRLGFITLFALSLLHVFLEFPLNFHSIIGIWKELKSR